MKNTTVSVPFMLLGIVFCVCLIAANLLETKIIQIGSLTITAGFLIFPVSYIINDCIVEVWGFRKARLIIWTGFAMNFLMLALFQVAVALPPPHSGKARPRFVLCSGWLRALPQPVCWPFWWALSSTPIS